MDHFAEMQIQSGGNVTGGRKRYVVTPTTAPVEIQHLPVNQSREIVERLKLNKENNLQNALIEVKDRALAAAALPRAEKRQLAWERAQTHISILRWVPALNASIVKADLAAGLTVGVMVIPQSISYAAIAGMPYVYGMYSAFVPTIIYAALGNSRHQVVGPVAIVCLLIEVGLRGRLTDEECPAWYAQDVATQEKVFTQYELCPTAYAQLAMLLALLVGLLQLAGGLLNVGFLVSFLGHPVMSGFTSGAAIIIGLSQVKDWLGYPVANSPVVHTTLINIFKDIHKTNGATLGLGITWFVALYAMRYASAKYKRLSFLRAAGPLIMCLVGICMMWAAPSLRSELGIKIVGQIPEGLPPWSGSTLKTGTLGRLITPAISIAVIGYMELIAIGKSLAAKHGYELPPGQELMAVGVANVFGACCSCFPVSGSFSRSAVNNAVGAKSQLSSFITGFFGLSFF
ncbi:sulfate transporter family-domain-containing protein [Pavlovales sp. CCMP2436]|nr:sulfate transporter family-domain-containing protein [Pavlovales sp. CCMP2436]